MKALTFRGKHNIQFEDIADPSIQSPADVIVNVKLCAICGSDLHVYHENEKGLDHATAMGHEFMGEIVEVGKEVKRLRVGDKVMSPFSVNCGKCFYCIRGLTSRCVQSQLFGWVEKGRGLHGAQAEFVRVPIAESTLIKVPDGISDEQALLLGDIVPTGYFCALQAEIKPENTYAVIGCGPVGLMAIMGARQLGAEQIYAIDTLPERLAIAKQFGATPIHANDQDAVAMLKEVTDNRGVDAVLEAVGNSATGKLAYQLVRPGGIISMVGVCNDTYMPFSPTEAYSKNLTFKVGRCPARFLMDRLILLTQSGEFDFTKIVTHRMKLRDGAKGYDLFANKKDNCLKVILS
jgi:2-desacetyl-2-hydroxyethyl bacteriochlorophyllide A dehydrogenase